MRRKQRFLFLVLNGFKTTPFTLRRIHFARTIRKRRQKKKKTKTKKKKPRYDSSFYTSFGCATRVVTFVVVVIVVVVVVVFILVDDAFFVTRTLRLLREKSQK